METSFDFRFRSSSARSISFAFALCSIGIFLVAAISAAPPPSDWAIVSSPNTSDATNSLEDVTCTSASDCWAVGYSFGSSAQQTLIQHWDGTSWQIVPSPNTSATQHNVLQSVTCASASECWAVGSSENGDAEQTLIVRWNGASWSIVPSPNNGALTNVLNGVTCAAASNCFAVGTYLYETGDPVFKPTAFGTLIERWDGVSWSIVPSPDEQVPGCSPFPSESCTRLDNILRDVTCISASDCRAVGGSGSSGLIQRWDGTSWQIVDSADNGERTFALQSVTCTSSSDCWAAGYFYEPGSNAEFPQTLIERWNGTAWSTVPSPNPSETSSLVDVTCASPMECWAVGAYGKDEKTLTLIQKWDGNAWSTVPSADVAGQNQNRLNGVTCTSASDCWAVGLTSGSDGIKTLIERYTRDTAIAPAQLLNISTRLRVQSGDNVLIGGFIVTGNQPKKIILRAIGPSLSINSAPVSGRLKDPTLELQGEGGVQIAANDNWMDSPQRAEIEASTIAPPDRREAAIIRTLAPGPYTATVRGAGGTTGIALVEAYDVAPGADSQMANISTRGFVATGDKVMIGGFILGPQDRGNSAIVVRAIGPSLTSKGVPGALQDPTLALHDQNGTLLVKNDNWKDAQRAEIEATGIPPSDVAESAIVRVLGSGSYTAIVRGKAKTTGVALVEVYNLGSR